MVGQFFERLSVLVFLTGFLAFALGFGGLAFGLVILACLLSPN